MSNRSTIPSHKRTYETVRSETQEDEKDEQVARPQPQPKELSYESASTGVSTVKWNSIETKNNLSTLVWNEDDHMMIDVDDISRRMTSSTFSSVMVDLCLHLTFQLLAPKERILCMTISKQFYHGVRRSELWKDVTWIHDEPGCVLPIPWLHECLGSRSIIRCTMSEFESIMESRRIKHLIVSEVISYGITTQQKQHAIMDINTEMRRLHLESLELTLHSYDPLCELFIGETSNSQNQINQDPYPRLYLSPVIWDWRDTLHTLKLHLRRVTFEVLCQWPKIVWLSLHHLSINAFIENQQPSQMLYGPAPAAANYPPMNLHHPLPPPPAVVAAAAAAMPASAAGMGTNTTNMGHVPIFHRYPWLKPKRWHTSGILSSSIPRLDMSSTSGLLPDSIKTFFDSDSFPLLEHLHINIHSREAGVYLDSWRKHIEEFISHCELLQSIDCDIRGSGTQPTIVPSTSNIQYPITLVTLIPHNINQLQGAKGLSHLRSLDMRSVRNSVSMIDLFRIVSKTNLPTLESWMLHQELNHEPIYTINEVTEMSEIIGSMDSLTNLQLQIWMIQSSDAVIWWKLIHLFPSLKRFNFTCSHHDSHIISTEQAESIAAISHLESLCIRDQSANGMERLCRIWCHGSDTMESGAKDLGPSSPSGIIRLQTPTLLHTLHLSMIELNSCNSIIELTSIVKSLKFLPSLTELYLHVEFNRNGVDHDDLVLWPNIIELTSDPSRNYLSRLSDLSNLEHLRISDNYYLFDNPLFQSWTRENSFPKLRSLRLDDSCNERGRNFSTVASAGMDRLFRLPKLDRLHLFAVPIVLKSIYREHVQMLNNSRQSTLNLTFDLERQQDRSHISIRPREKIIEYECGCLHHERDQLHVPMIRRGVSF